VERTFGWPGRYRRHSRDYERRTDSSEAMIQLSMIHRMARRLEPGPIAPASTIANNEGETPLDHFPNGL
jgi:hypothetical protein